MNIIIISLILSVTAAQTCSGSKRKVSCLIQSYCWCDAGCIVLRETHKRKYGNHQITYNHIVNIFEWLHIARLDQSILTSSTATRPSRFSRHFGTFPRIWRHSLSAVSRVRGKALLIELSMPINPWGTRSNKIKFQPAAICGSRERSTTWSGLNLIVFIIF